MLDDNRRKSVTTVREFHHPVSLLATSLPSHPVILTTPFIAIDPGLFREREEFNADVTRLCNDLRATTPVDPAQPVMVAGDPQWNNAAKRMREGIPVGPGHLNQVRQIAQACAAPWLLD